MNLDLTDPELDTGKMLNNRRGPKSHPDKGISCIVPCRLGTILRELKRTQVDLADAISSTPAFTRMMGKTRLSRGTLALVASGRLIASAPLLAVLCAYLGQKPEDIYEPYILGLIDKQPSRWVKEGGYWNA